jgi:hypothetical protein
LFRLSGSFLATIPQYLPSFQYLEVVSCDKIKKSLLKDFAEQNPLIKVRH